LRLGKAGCNVRLRAKTGAERPHLPPSRNADRVAHPQSPFAKELISPQKEVWLHEMADLGSRLTTRRLRRDEEPVGVPVAVATAFEPVVEPLRRVDLRAAAAPAGVNTQATATAPRRLPNSRVRRSAR
jgi:hypothetical protein